MSGTRHPEITSLGKCHLEVHTDIYCEAPIVRIVETVLADVSQSDVIACIEVKHVETHTTAQLESAIKALEVTIIEGAERCSVTIVLDIAIGSYCKISASIGLNARLVADKVLVLDEQRNLEIVEIVGELVVARTALATLLTIIKSTLDEQGGTKGELGASCKPDIEARLGAAAIKQRAIAAHV